MERGAGPNGAPAPRGRRPDAAPDVPRGPAPPPFGGAAAGGDPRPLAGWLIAQRPRIDGAFATRLGPAAPRAGAPETEALRRFRTFASALLLRGERAAPALDGLASVSERRVEALVGAWAEAAAEVAGPDASAVRSALAPALARFRGALRGTASARRARGAPRAQRRAVVAAIDRVADAFLAVDVESARIADANPAAGAMLGVHRDALVGVEALSFVPGEQHDRWWGELDAVAEGAEERRFRAALRDARGACVEVEARATGFGTRGRILALLLLRPLGPGRG